MSRRHKAEKRPKTPDARYNSELIAHFINHIMRDGKRSTAERVVYGALDVVREKSGCIKHIDVRDYYRRVDLCQSLGTGGDLSQSGRQ